MSDDNAKSIQVCDKAKPHCDLTVEARTCRSIAYRYHISTTRYTWSGFSGCIRFIDNRCVVTVLHML